MLTATLQTSVSPSRRCCGAIAALLLIKSVKSPPQHKLTHFPACSHALQEVQEHTHTRAQKVLREECSCRGATLPSGWRHSKMRISSFRTFHLIVCVTWGTLALSIRARIWLSGATGLSLMVCCGCEQLVSYGDCRPPGMQINVGFMAF